MHYFSQFWILCLGGCGMDLSSSRSRLWLGFCECNSVWKKDREFIVCLSYYQLMLCRFSRNQCWIIWIRSYLFLCLLQRRLFVNHLFISEGRQVHLRLIYLYIYHLPDDTGRIQSSLHRIEGWEVNYEMWIIWENALLTSYTFVWTD